jgi:hypothetical protein
MEKQLDIFYNSTGLTGTELALSRMKAGSDSKLILSLFRCNPGQSFTPFEVCERLNFDYFRKINSVRRSMSDLTDMGFLVATSEMRTGVLGKPNHCWRLA